LSEALSGGAVSVEVILCVREPAFRAPGLFGRVLVLGNARTIFDTGLSGVALRGLKIEVSGPAVHSGREALATSVFRLLSMAGFCGIISFSASLDCTFGSLLKCETRERGRDGDTGRQKSLT